MFEKHLWKSDILNNYAGHRPASIDLHLYLKCYSSTSFFKHFAGKNQLPGFYIAGTLVENGLNKISHVKLTSK